MIVAMGLGPVVAELPPPSTEDAMVLTVVALGMPAVFTEVFARIARARSGRVLDRIIINYCHLAPISTAAALYFGRLPAWLGVVNPDAPSSLQLATALGPALLISFITIAAEQRLHTILNVWDAPRVADRVRMAALPLLAPVPIAALYDIAALSQRFRIYHDSFATVQVAVFGLVAAGLFLMFPVLVLAVIRTTPLPQGRLLSMFDRVAAKSQVKVAGFHVADTGLAVSNAALLGGIGARRVILTDRILYEHPDDELVAVVGHELGHAKARHLRLFALFLGSVGIWVLNVPEAWVQPLGSFGLVAAGLIAMVIILFFGFGPIARLCEHEADLYGARAAGSGDPLVASLERIAGPDRRDVSSWRHPSVASRVRFLQAAAADRYEINRPRRILKIVERSSVLVLIAGLGFTAFQQSKDLPRQRVVASLRASDFAAALDVIKNESIAGRATKDMSELEILANALARTGGAGDKSLRSRAQGALERGDLADAAAFARLTALRTGRRSDLYFADVVVGLREREIEYVVALLDGPATFLARDPALGPTIRRAVEDAAAPGTNDTRKSTQGNR